MPYATRNTRRMLFAVVVSVALGAAAWSAMRAVRHAGMPALDANAASYITKGVHDVSRPLRDIDQRAAAIDPCAEPEVNVRPLFNRLHEVIGELFGGACGGEAEREAEEALSAANTTTLAPMALANVPDGGSVEQTSYGPQAPLPTVASFNSGLNSALDNNIAVGPNNLVAMINSRFQVMSKTGAVTFGPVQNNSIFSGFANGVCANSGDGHVQYDQLAHRWLFTVPNFSSGYWICYAVSTTDDPTGSYYRYAFPRPLFPDYPRVAVWADGYYTTTSTGDNVIQKAACVVDRAKMLTGQAATQQCFTVNNVSFMEPANIDGQTLPPPGAPELVFAAGGAQLNSVLQDDGIYVYKFHVDWNTPANSTLTGPAKIDVSPYSFLCGGQLVSCVPQPGSTTRLDAQGDKIMHRAAYRNISGVQSIVLQHSVNTLSGGGGPRWYEFRVNAGGNPELYQQSTYAPDARYRWMGSIGMDRKGDIAIGFSYGGGPYTLPMTTSSCVQPACDRVGVRFTARQIGDPLGVMTYADGIIASSASPATGGSNRWEDWSVLAIDPSDDCTFWYNGGYMPSGATSYNGQIGAWRLANCRLDATGAAATPVPTQQFSGAVATFTDSDLTATVATFTASIDWGDGTSSAGTISGGSGSFSVSGSHTYAGSGSRIITTAITGAEGSTASATSDVLVSSAGSAPTATLVAPSSSTPWSVGEALAFSATASDAEDGQLQGSAMAWTLILHRCPSTCDTQILETRTGVSGGTFTALPDAGYPSTLDVVLTVTDSSGLQTTKSVTLQPRTVNLAFASVPSGLQLTVGTVTSTTPFSRTLIVGSTNAVNAPSPQAGYQFASWSDAGVQSHTIVAPPSAATFTATFTGPPPGSPKAISVNFVGSGTSMGATESAGVVAKTNWNNATGASRTTAFALKDETGAATSATVTWTANSSWMMPITDQAGNRRLMKGYLDSANTSTTTVTVAGLLNGAYDIYVYADGDNGSAQRTAAYTISGSGITTTTVNLTDTASANFNTAFTQATNSAGNYVKFSITSAGFTVSTTPVQSADAYRRAPLNGIQIVPAGPPIPDFTVSLVPSSRTVTQGGATSYAVTLDALNGFTGQVALATTGLPANTTAIITPSTLTGAGTATLDITTVGGTPTGSSTLTVTGTSGALSHASTATLIVSPPPDFTIAVTPSSRSVNPGGMASYTVTVGATNGFTGQVALTTTGLPPNTTATFTPPIVSGAGATTLNVTTAASTPPGNSTLTVTGTSGTLSHGVTTSLAVTTAQALGVISIDFVGNGVAMGATESAGVVAKTNWNNATGASRTTAFALKDDTGAATSATVTWTANSLWTMPITDQAGNRRLMKGYLDSANTSTTTVTVAGLPNGAYDIYVYADGDNGSAQRTAAYTISGAGITTTTVSLIDTANTNFNTAFTPGTNSAGNYLKFSITASGFSVSATPVQSTDAYRRAPLNGIQIVPTAP